MPFREIIYDADYDTTIGYSDDIVEDFLTNGDGDDELVAELINELKKLDHELVYITYHPMGAFTCYRLEPKETLFVV